MPKIRSRSKLVASPWWWSMTDLVTRLQRLSGSNPVARVILLPEDWPEIERLLKSAVEHNTQGDEK